MAFPPHIAQTLHTTVTLRADQVTHSGGAERGPFGPGALAEFVGHPVLVPGLDTGYTHTVVGVDTSEDGTEVRLQVRTDLMATHDIAQHLNISVHTPEAVVQLVDHETGEVLYEGTHSAPLQNGRQHRVNGQLVEVVSHSWPQRHPTHGAVQADPDTGHYPVDHQRVRVRRVGEPVVTLKPGAMVAPPQEHIEERGGVVDPQ